MYNIKVSQNLRALMRRSDMNQTELSIKTGISQPTLHRMLNGEIKSPKLPMLMPLCDFFGVTLDALVGWSPLPRNVGQQAAPKLAGVQKELVDILDEVPPGLQESIRDHARLIRDLHRSRGKSGASKRNSQ